VFSSLLPRVIGYRLRPLRMGGWELPMPLNIVVDERVFERGV